MNGKKNNKGDGEKREQERRGKRGEQEQGHMEREKLAIRQKLTNYDNSTHK